MYKQIEAIDSLLPQEDKMEYVKYCILANLRHITINTQLVNGGHLSHNGKQ